MKFVMKLIILCLIIMILSVNVFANINVSDYLAAKTIPTDLKGKGEIIIRAVQVVATIVALGTFAILGIRLMLSSPSQKADIKSHMMPYLVGAVLVFSIVPLLVIIQNIANRFYN